MSSPQFSLHQIMAIVRRRRVWIILPLLLVTALSIVGSLILPRRYESSTTIWVQRDEILNPLVSFTMAVQLASEDRLRTFNEIVYSRQTIEALIDSLGMRASVPTPAAMDELIDRTKASIRTDRSGSDSFTMIFADTDPTRAQRAVTTLASMFIQTRLRAEFQRNEYTVQFFENKLREYEAKYGKTQSSMVSLLKQRSQETPGGAASFAGRFDILNERIREASERIRERERAIATIALFPEAFRTDRGRAALSELLAIDAPNATDLRPLTLAYDSVTSRYTPRHPEVGKVESRIMDVLERTRVMLQSEMSILTSRLSETQKTRAELVQAITQSSISQTVDRETESNYSFYQQLFNDMRVKLEQARIARELGRNAQNAFIIIDPARIPTKPTKPNRMLIVAGGILAGLFLGAMSAVVVELLDTTIRSPREIEVFGKPIIALIPQGIHQS